MAVLPNINNADLGSPKKPPVKPNLYKPNFEIKDEQKPTRSSSTR